MHTISMLFGTTLDCPTNLTPNVANPLDVTKTKLSGQDYIVETYVIFSEGDNPLLIASETIHFS